MRDASPALLDLLLERHARDPDDSTTRSLLMASCAPEAMTVIANTARIHEATRKILRDLGFHLPPAGPAEPRFDVERHALHYLPGSDPTSAEHAIGLPLDEVAASGEDAITFHYLWSRRQPSPVCRPGPAGHTWCRFATSLAGSCGLPLSRMADRGSSAMSTTMTTRSTT